MSSDEKEKIIQKLHPIAAFMSIPKLKKKLAPGQDKFSASKYILNLIYQVGIKISVLVSIITILFHSVVDMFEDKVVFEPFVIPASIEAKGYTGTLLVQEITDRINLIREQVKKSDQEKFIKIEAIDQSTKIQVPGTGVSLREITDFIRTFLGTTVRTISGNVVIADDQLLLTVRVPERLGIVFKGTLKDINALIQQSAEHILKNLDPFTLGKYYSIQKNIPAMQELVKYIKASDSTSQEVAIAYLIAGLSLFDQEDYNGALREWDIATTRDPKNIIAFVYQGWALDHQGRFQEAIEKYKKVLQLDPNNVSAYNNWGITLYIMKEYKNAIFKFRKLIKLAPDYPHGFNNLGYALFELGRHEEGIKYIKKAINLEPKESAFYNSLGEGLLALGKYQEAIVQFKQTLKLDPQNAEAYHLWGQVLVKLGQQEDAKEKFNKANELDPDQY